MPVSAETVAYIAAGGTAVGALIGATAGGVVDLLMARSTVKRRAKVGARLVRGDLAMAASHLRSAEKDGRWWVYYDTNMQAWEEYRDALADRLNDADMETVSQSTMELAHFHEKLERAPEPPAGYRSLPKSGPALRIMRENATKAWNALAGPAEGETITGLLHEDE